jgi:hypothetical protein
VGVHDGPILGATFVLDLPRVRMSGITGSSSELSKLKSGLLPV